MQSLSFPLPTINLGELTLSGVFNRPPPPHPAQLAPRTPALEAPEYVASAIFAQNRLTPQPTLLKPNQVTLKQETIPK